MSSPTQTDPPEQAAVLEELDFDKLVNPTLENIVHRIEGGSPHRPLKCNWKVKLAENNSDQSIDSRQISIFIVVKEYFYVCKFQIEANEWLIFRCSAVDFAMRYDDDSIDIRDPQSALETIEWLVKNSGKPRKIAELPKRTGETFDSIWQDLESQ